MDTFISHSPEQTAAAGEEWGRVAQSGWIIGLSGDLGAGKTQWVSGFARGLGCPARVHSPTFGLVHEYQGGRLPLAHLDLYRLETPAQVAGAGLEDYLIQPEGITVVEWIERWPEFFTVRAGAGRGGTRLRRVLIENLGEHERRIVYEDLGV
jgi:tRNA threonylcarbamoyladenosine biosynthesis protein TsaE